MTSISKSHQFGNNEAFHLVQQDYLVEGNVYTRKDLREMFSITDKTLETGVFQPSDQQAIWLFVTEKKSPDMPQLHDYLDGTRL